jgi:hypothetical protein
MNVPVSLEVPGMKRLLVPIVGVSVPLLSGLALVLVLTMRVGPREVKKPGYVVWTTGADG